MQISIKTSQRENINLEVEDSSKTIDLKIYGPTRQLVLGLNGDTDAYQGSDALMRIFVSTIKDKTFILQVKGSDTIKKIKTMIHDQGGLPVDQLNLNFLGTKLENSRTVATITSSLTQILSLCSGVAFAKVMSLFVFQNMISIAFDISIHK